MKKVILLLGCFCLSITGIWAQTQDEDIAPVPQTKFKPHYAGTSIDAGFMWTPGFGSAYYMAPKISFQATPRLFLNTGISVVQYSLLPSQINPDISLQHSTTGIYVFAEGAYLLNEKWSVNGSVMKEVSAGPLRQVSPYCVPSEAMHIGVDYKITPNITVGARVGYSNGGRNSIYGPYSPFSPF